MIQTARPPEIGIRSGKEIDAMALQVQQKMPKAVQRFLRESRILTPPSPTDNGQHVVLVREHQMSYLIGNEAQRISVVQLQTAAPRWNSPAAKAPPLPTPTVVAV